MSNDIAFQLRRGRRLPQPRCSRTAAITEHPWTTVSAFTPNGGRREPGPAGPAASCKRWLDVTAQGCASRSADSRR